jgi:uncharacterized protein YbjT (DUF2867 family)
MIIVIGATGHVGTELVCQLAERGENVRALVRSPAKATKLPTTADMVVGDLENLPSLLKAYHGADRLFLLVPGIEHETARTALLAARETGIKRIVYLSSYAVAIAPLPPMGCWHHEREQLIRASGIAATFLRPVGFATNTFDWMQTLRESGYVLDPTGPGRAALIDPADIAAVATVALTEDGHAGKAYTLTGGEALTVAEQVAIISAVIGREIAVRDVASPEEVVRFRYPNGAPPSLAAALVEGLRSMRSDRRGLITTTVQNLVGRPPRSFRQWCEANAAALRSVVDGER